MYRYWKRYKGPDNNVFSLQFFSCVPIPAVAPNFMLALQGVSQRISKTNPGTTLKADHENKKGEAFKYGTMSTSVPPPQHHAKYPTRPYLAGRASVTPTAGPSGCCTRPSWPAWPVSRSTARALDARSRILDHLCCLAFSARIFMKAHACFCRWPPLVHGSYLALGCL